MRLPRTKAIRAFAACAASIALVLTGVQAASATPLPNRFSLESHFGWEVNKATRANVCKVKEECQEAKASSEPGGFSLPIGAAVEIDSSNANYEDVYVTDRGNHRVQVLTSSGQFVSTFGWDVNRTKAEEPTASQAERNVCTAVSKDVCQAGAEGGEAGQFDLDDTIAIDPTSGDIYVADTRFGEVGEEEFAVAQRIEKFTAAGQFVLEIGKGVNQTSKANLCLAGETCGPATLQTPTVAEADAEAGAFDFEAGYGNLITVGGPDDLLYVGGNARVQEFDSSGKPAGKEIPLTALSPSAVTSVAVDATGDVFVANSENPGIYEYNESDALQTQVIDPSATVVGLAVDPHGRLGVLEGGGGVRRGSFYTTAGMKLSEFAPPSGEMHAARGLAFASSASDKLNAEETPINEVESYKSIIFPETHTCAPSQESGTSAKLCGEINPDGVQANGFFEYGTSASLGSQTLVAFEGSGEAFEPVSLQLTGLEPNQEYHYRVAAEAQAGGETLLGHGEEQTFQTAIVEPQIVGQPSASFVKAQSAVVSASVNPEHASTRYHYEYGACPKLAGCVGVQSTPDEVSSVYGPVGSTWELIGLAPSTTYSYRLVASNESEVGGKPVGGKVAGPEGSFTTAAAPSPSATTGVASVLGPTSAIIAGTVNPDGLPGDYVFELGVYNGAATQYGIVLSGPAGSGTAPIEETFLLAGLQPGTTYAYRITVESGYIQNESHTIQGAIATFTTPGLPTVLEIPTVPTLLPTPNIAFPKAVKITSKSKKKAKTKPKHHKKTKKKAGKKAAHRSSARRKR
jgi:hypothetical protein